MNEFYDRLDELYGAGDLAAVEEYILSAAEEAAAGSPRQAGLYNELAGFYRGISRYAESEDVFMRALSIFEDSGMGATTEYATVLLNLAGLYRMRGEADKAVTLFRGAMEKLESAGASDSYAYVSVLNNLALAYQEKKDFAQALEYAERALVLIQGDVGKEHEISASFNNLAAINLQLGRLAEAEDYVTKALGIYDSMEETDVHHAAALTTRSVILCRKKDYAGALTGFRKALELTRRFFGENIEYAICRRNIADVCEMLGDTASAAAELSDAARVMEKILGAGHKSVGEVRARIEKLKVT